jgi:hypothetical protein
VHPITKGNRSDTHFYSPSTPQGAGPFVAMVAPIKSFLSVNRYQSWPVSAVSNVMPPPQQLAYACSTVGM